MIKILTISFNLRYFYHNKKLTKSNSLNEKLNYSEKNNTVEKGSEESTHIKIKNKEVSNFDEPVEI